MIFERDFAYLESHDNVGGFDVRMKLPIREDAPQRSELDVPSTSYPEMAVGRVWNRLAPARR